MLKDIRFISNGKWFGQALRTNVVGRKPTGIFNIIAQGKGYGTGSRSMNTHQDFPGTFQVLPFHLGQFPGHLPMPPGQFFQLPANSQFFGSERFHPFGEISGRFPDSRHSQRIAFTTYRTIVFQYLLPRLHDSKSRFPFFLLFFYFFQSLLQLLLLTPYRHTVQEIILQIHIRDRQFSLRTHLHTPGIEIR